MEGAIQAVVKTFLKSSKGKENIGKKDFQNLVSSQLGNILSGADSKEAVNNMAQGLDSDADGKVGFEEYMKLIGYLACSLSEQRVLNKEEPAENNASQPVQSSPGGAAEQPKENAEPKEEPKPKENDETKADPTAEATVEAKADANAEVKVEPKVEGETKPEAATVEAAASAEVKATEKDPEKAEETPKAEEPTEKSPAAAEENVAAKTEEASS
ncbi:fibrous sheath CABYR-binding protein-like [Poecilia latipinna]|uniref:S100 calcium binding protein U n=2 Tax=Poecilia TaxID=8080 RepID=A0A087XVC8_POEFO|nr:PREDICTED: fibrous sheath CABYR-binding protein-like [Poecilia formosa]XP_014903410.1 PREDICTED: fibrous sheath CABYR-binding protein-like [Poecilia latipinna]